MAEGRQICPDCEKGTDGGGPVGACLLDLMAIQMGCTFLSDLRFLDGGRRTALAEKLKKVPVREADLHDWNDALNYLTGDGPRASAEDAKAALIAGLSAQ